MAVNKGWWTALKMNVKRLVYRSNDTYSVANFDDYDHSLKFERYGNDDHWGYYNQHAYVDPQETIVNGMKNRRQKKHERITYEERIPLDH